MAKHFKPNDRGRLAIVDVLPLQFAPSARLADHVLAEVAGLYSVELMSWRQSLDDVVVYLLLNDSRPIFADRVATLYLPPPRASRATIRLGYYREPATDKLIKTWQGNCRIVRREAAWKNAVQDLTEEFADEAVGALRLYYQTCIDLASSGELLRSGTSRPEELLKVIARRVYPNAGFSRVRPPWLLGRKGKPLELDIYSSKLKVAIEVQGPYHTQAINGVEMLAAQQDRDEWKRTRCREEGVALITVNASALQKRVLALSDADQDDWLRAIVRYAEQNGFYDWPDQGA